VEKKAKAMPTHPRQTVESSLSPFAVELAARATASSEAPSANPLDNHYQYSMVPGLGQEVGVASHL